MLWQAIYPYLMRWIKTGIQIYGRKHSFLCPGPSSSLCMYPLHCWRNVHVLSKTPSTNLEDQSAEEEKLLANYHTSDTTIQTHAADAALALATSVAKASCCICCGRERASCIGLACRQGQNLWNKSWCLCLIGYHAKLSNRPAGQRQGSGTIWAPEITISLGISLV